jgi:hypothetical protein
LHSFVLPYYSAKKTEGRRSLCGPQLFITELAQWVNLTSDDASLDLG